MVSGPGGPGPPRPPREHPPDGLCVTLACSQPRVSQSSSLLSRQALRFFQAPPPTLLASFLPGVTGRTAPEEALNVAQAERPEGGGREAWAGVPAPTWTPTGSGPMTLICLASQTLPLSPVPSPPDSRSKSPGRVRGADFPLGICIFFGKKKKRQANLEKLGTSPANFSF